jgi:hypothetical protein
MNYPPAYIIDMGYKFERTKSSARAKTYRTWLAKATAKDPAQRYQSANDIVAFFDRTLRRTTLPHQVSLKTFGIIYSPDVETEVQDLLQRFRLMAERIPGVSFRISDS